MTATESIPTSHCSSASKPTGEMLWSTQYGNGQQNAAHAMCDSNDKVWMVGYSSNDWTFEGFNPEFYELYNALGEQVDASASMNWQQETIDVSQFASGVYLIKLSSGNKSTTLKFVIE